MECLFKTPKFRPVAVRLLKLPYLLQDLLVRWAHCVVSLNKPPAHHSLLIDQISGWVRPAFTVGIENSITIDDFVVSVLKHRKALPELFRGVELLAQFSRVLMTVDADRKNLSLLAVLSVQ